MAWINSTFAATCRGITPPIYAPTDNLLSVEIQSIKDGIIPACSTFDVTWKSDGSIPSHENLYEFIVFTMPHTMRFIVHSCSIDNPQDTKHMDNNSDKPSSPQTSWHLSFAQALKWDLSPVDISVLPEERVMSELPRVDIILKRTQPTWTTKQLVHESGSFRPPKDLFFHSQFTIHNSQFTVHNFQGVLEFPLSCTSTLSMFY